MLVEKEPFEWDEQEARYRFNQAVKQPAIEQIVYALLFEDDDKLARLRVQIKKARARTEALVQQFLAADNEQKKQIAGSITYMVPEVLEEEVNVEKIKMRKINESI